MCEKKILSPCIINPFFYYALFWSITLFIYFISPSKLSVGLDENLLRFLWGTIIISIIIAFFFNVHYKNKKIKLKYYKQKSSIRIVLILLYMLEFLYCKSIPLLSGKSYIDFGIPTLHVIIVTLSCYYAIKNYFQFITFRNREDLVNLLIVVAYFILIFSRGMLLFLAAIAIALTLYDKKINIKYIVLAGILGIVIAWLFGVAGNLRSGYQWNDSSLIICFGQVNLAHDSLFGPFVWVEEYLICSLRNLNYNITHVAVENSLMGQLYCMIPDFISKRAFGGYEVIPKLQVPIFTTSTMYAKTYISLGYLGMIMNFILYFLVYYIFVRVNMIDMSNKIVGYAVLSLIYALSIFNDMLWYSGYSFALVYCLILGIKPSLRKYIPHFTVKKQKTYFYYDKKIL